MDVTIVMDYSTWTLERSVKFPAFHEWVQVRDEGLFIPQG